MEVLQKVITKASSSIWFSNYAERPSKLFTGSEVLLTITLLRAEQGDTRNSFTTGFTKWASEEREALFERIVYSKVAAKPKQFVVPKLSSVVEPQILEKLGNQSGLGTYLRDTSKYPIYYRIGGGRYWKIFTNFQPKFILNEENSVSSRENYIYLETPDLRSATISVLSSSLFYWYFIITTNCRDLNPIDLRDFPISLDQLSHKNLSDLQSLCAELMHDYETKSQMKEKTSSLTGHIVYQEFYPKLSKTIIDEIDRVLAKHYGFTQEELDFIINYDIKYRMGKGGEED